ncbi:PAS domain-containing response regulator [Halobacterium sp. KA-6]|uniref:PAS domain-containing response regulator n=1 Tax=Halobacterium sp. KA-6 TaxID=2896368 RepID=UPI001E503445|nr:PAS domain S-box protein [Halobacterium sp. KA-6]MCD2204485.1 PAS domain S-box protein [Halobacterium sp. KA-6]
MLHVDDEPDLAELAAEFLSREDDRLSVQTATNAESGLDILADHEIDCIVSDYDMPGKNGIEFLETVRDEHPDLPFILFTGKGSEEIASDAISAGVTDYLQKDTGSSQYTVLANRITNAVEQHRSMRALEASQERLSMFFEQSPLGVIEWTEDFEFARMNEAAETILGYDEAELRGESGHVIVEDAEQDDVAAIVAELLENKGGYHSINQNVRKDGERLICEWHNRVVTDQAGEVVAIFSQFQDITERRNQQKEVERHRAVIQAATNTILTLDDTGDIQSVNPAVEATFGYAPTEVRGESVTKLLTETSAERYQSIFTENPETEAAPFDWMDAELEGQHRDGTAIPISVTFSEVTHEGEQLFVGIIRDISERKSREAELQRKERGIKRCLTIRIFLWA